jgi:hypothetical protein
MFDGGMGNDVVGPFLLPTSSRRGQPRGYLTRPIPARFQHPSLQGSYAFPSEFGREFGRDAYNGRVGRGVA